MDSTVERQAIRAAVALASASSRAATPEAIADLREEASQLIGLCIRQTGADALRAWCAEASDMLTRLSEEDALPQPLLLAASAAVLHLRLGAARLPTPAVAATPSGTGNARRRSAHTATPRPAAIGGNKRKVVQFITEHPDIRTKDLVDGLKGTLSPRSIKRYLKELVASGAIRRSETGDGGVAYSVSQ